MNPKEFPWTEDQQVTVTNPTADTYNYKVHNKEYSIGPGETQKMPGFMAWVYVYGLSTQIAQAEDVFSRWNEEGFRKEFYDRLVVGADNLIQAVEVEKPVIEPVEDEPEDSQVLPSGGETYTPEASNTTEPAIKAMRRGRPSKI